MNRVGRAAKIPSHRWGKWVILVLWIGALAFLAPLATKLSEVENNRPESWLPGTAESTRVLAAVQEFRSGDQIPAIVVYEKPGGLTPADLTLIAGNAHQLTTIDGVAGATGPFTSGERPPQAAEVVVPVSVGTQGFNKLAGIVDDIRTTAAQGVSGISVHVTGPGGNNADSSRAFAGIDSALLFAALGVVIVMLLITYRSPILWVFPVLSVGAALMASEGVIYLFAKYAGLTVNGQSAGILTVLVFGAGTDYALLLVARYREELRRHFDRHEAMAFALHRAGPAVWASAATVIAGMLCLMLAELNSTAGLGPVGAIGIGVGLLAMVTLLPALLVIFGRWVFWPVKPDFGSAEGTRTGLWARVGRRIDRAPRVTWVVTSLVLVVLALGTLTLRADGLSNAGTYTNVPDSVVGEQVLARHFPAGAGQPIQIVSNSAQAGQVRAAAATVPGVSSVSTPVVRDGAAYIEAITRDAPDSGTASATLQQVRDAVHGVPGADAIAGGPSAVRLDTRAASTADRDLIIPIVLTVVFLILVVLLRALLAPVLLIATVVLSFFSTLGISAFFFNHVFGFEGADPSFPLYVFVFLVALGIDYNIFLMTRIREEAGQQGTRQGALAGLAATGGVITSAGLVLAGTFAVLGTLPLTFLAEVGFAVAIGVLIDTIVVRAILVTALTLDIGRWIWWPSRLMRLRDPEPQAGRARTTPRREEHHP
ncbi:MMPL family transporter [Amycolatopsis pigmentata]|uniref:MMPL family transporter n=1 Tax=Amycolatopsis pigmentata TaxID=450801 RepID=A0ABW5G4E4_9PSEU